MRAGRRTRCRGPAAHSVGGSRAVRTSRPRGRQCRGAELGRRWEISPQQWQNRLDINLTGLWNIVRAIVPPMIAAGNGGPNHHHQFGGGINAVPGCGHYCGSKFGVVGLTDSLAVELREFGPMGNDNSIRTASFGVSGRSHGPSSPRSAAGGLSGSMRRSNSTSAAPSAATRSWCRSCPNPAAVRIWPASSPGRTAAATSGSSSTAPNVEHQRIRRPLRSLAGRHRHWDVSKHERSDDVLVPLDAPGITMGQLNQVDGGNEFWEEFFDDLELSDDAVVGGVNQRLGRGLATALSRASRGRRRLGVRQRQRAVSRISRSTMSSCWPPPASPTMSASARWPAGHWSGARCRNS